ncbi:cation:dicarboxylate symporter family transporter [Clostridium saccharobutylicum]|uniref:Proton/sodium-glutamate symport protein GltT n=1 Tax=Clostridium saccharobutylicum DSM 13864 TaxID=1345695 RepID=U5MRG4_CLOSA|nr:cation:dicarboxylase symporter family transporter [Clostridium saccharobutylicum]AGX42012.1 proton/sodium-glutamate symport protein GltT [Clostridium saccharobutylicum DSM 13864]AQR89290.1 proton/sodium-glutamate symport protein [Clostridium saccharobutylicum]AQR99191.1 proton/sodium-glutamate symport protein [Clostridium saccharobutylicum]AQS13179.1 proton/sodium-glutamate symport protein [Clostridium saccharobutylicum]MBA2906212.1 proton glutamate symport protein [Clostridium saccharobuty
MKKSGLAIQIILGLILGIIVGAIFYGNPVVVSYLQPFGDIFIRLIKMIVVPIVFSSLVVGVAGVGDIKKVGKIGGKTILYFEVVTTFAIIIGLLVANLAHPGNGVNISELSTTSIDKYMSTAQAASNHGFMDTFINIVPTNIFESLAKGDLLPIIFFSVMFGLGVAAIGEKGKPVLNICQGVADAMFWVTNQIMKVAPLGVFGLIGVTVSKFGLASLIPLGKLVITVYCAMIFFVFVVLGFVAKLSGTSILSLIKILKDEIILAYTTASSEAVLPKLMEKMEKFGCPKAITSFVIPTGYSFNLDGSTLYQAIAALFIAQIYGIHLPLSTQINLVLVLMLTSKGMAGVPGASFVVLLATVGSVGIPVEGVAFIAGIDRIVDMARTTVNVIGNSLAVVVISKWEKQYDAKEGEQYLKSIEEVA